MFFAGLVLLIIGSVIIFYSTSYNSFDYGYSQSQVIYRYLDSITYRITKSVMFETDSSRFSAVFFAGFYLTIIGALLSVFYEKTIGKVVKWVKIGS